ncbi:MAG: SUMF1/EgtB/PvdO family nonheme iron enzyme [Candidatus Delongbacteria bacterium]|jgi:formylglycine-generating enzyme required for sulfatase activity|nr:SUMF1/EgtB/PvdO family nonheme iron enzyme [Candidatus Delongbacteria bacterium]
MKKWMFLVYILIFAGLIFWSCSSDDSSTEPTNGAPICEITSPAPYTAYNSGDTVEIKVNAEDSDGNIEEVRFYLDGVGVASVQTFPYDANIATTDLAIGEHVIEVVAEDDDATETELEIEFGIKPQAPTNLQVIQNNVYTFTVSWSDDNDGEDGFVIERKIDDGVFTEIVTTTETTFIDSTILNKGYSSVTYQVKVFKGIYSSDYVTNSYSILFPAPTNLTATAFSSTSLKLNWSDNSNGEDGFKIDRKVSNGLWVTNYATVGKDIITWTDNGYDSLEMYYYKVRAYYSIHYSESTELHIAPLVNGMVFVQGGTFEMGDHFNEGLSHELPVHSVSVSDYYIGSCEVTQSEWVTYMSLETDASFGIGDNYPVYSVSWYEIMVYCNKRSIVEGLTSCYAINSSTNPDNWGNIPTSNDLMWNAATCNWGANGYRLPTEAEWEYASRGGIHNADNYHYSGSDTINDVAWYDLNSGSISHPVGTKVPNQLGIYDMSGNLWELCRDWFGINYYATCDSLGTVEDPYGPSDGSNPVIRGGYWGFGTSDCRVAYRADFNTFSDVFSVGFRIARGCQIKK